MGRTEESPLNWCTFHANVEVGGSPASEQQSQGLGGELSREEAGERPLVPWCGQGCRGGWARGDGLGQGGLAGYQLGRGSSDLSGRA